MILGIGTDIVEIKHFKRVVDKNPAILERIFTPTELKKALTLSAKRQTAYYAKRFAAKEAFSKACGTGIGKRITWQDLEISNDPQGMPFIILSTQAKKFLQQKFKTEKIISHLSLSDEKEYAQAFAILEK